MKQLEVIVFPRNLYIKVLKTIFVGRKYKMTWYCKIDWIMQFYSSFMQALGGKSLLELLAVGLVVGEGVKHREENIRDSRRTAWWLNFAKTVKWLSMNLLGSCGPVSLRSCSVFESQTFFRGLLCPTNPAQEQKHFLPLNETWQKNFIF